MTSADPPPPIRWLELLERDQLAGYDVDGTQLAEAIWLAARWSESASSAAAVTTAGAGPAEELPLDETELPPVESVAPERPVPAPRQPAPSPGSGVRRPAPQRWMTGRGEAADAPDRERGAGSWKARAVAAAGLSTDQAAMFRALRPLKKACSAVRHAELDESRTAESTADAGALMLKFRRREERALELIVLIDVSQSMALWQHAARELLHILTRLGAFRAVAAWSFDADAAEPRFHPYRGSGVTGRDGGKTAVALTRSAGPRAYLVISDGVGQAWRQGAMADVCGGLARRSHVSLVNPLPHRMWRRSGIRTQAMHHRVSGARDTLAVRHARTRWSPPDRRTWLPVWHLDADELAVWARLMAGHPDRDRAGQSLLIRPAASDRPQPSGTAAAVATGSPAERVAGFRASASSSAFLLAARLAAVPMSLPVIRMVRDATSPGDGADLLAEVLLSGLMVRTSARTSGEDPDQVIYDFDRGIREQLLAALTRTEVLASLQVIAQAPDSMARIFGGTLNFRLLADAAGAARPLPEQAKHFAGVAVTVLSNLGPAYDDLAGRIGARLDSAAAGDFQLIRDGSFSAATTLTIVQLDGPARLTGDGAALGDLLADRLAADPQVRPDLFVGCENLVAAPTTAEVARSAAFFGRLLERFQLAADRLILAPGPAGWQSWGPYEYARAVAGRGATALLERALGCPEHSPDTWWRTELPEYAAAVTVLDSTQVTVPAHFGALGERQLAWLRAVGSPPQSHVVVMHHDPASRLLDARAFYDALPSPDLVLHGWGPSASLTSLAGGYTGAPAVPDPAAGYVVYRVDGRQVAIRGRQILPEPASGLAITSSIAFAARPALAAGESRRTKSTGRERPALIVDPYTPMSEVPAQERTP
jgi:hypothetical protein